MIRQFVVALFYLLLPLIYLDPLVILAQERSVATPGFWDPNLHLDRPELSGLHAIRFLTEEDNPPLNFALGDGSIAGFNADIGRAICEELQMACTIQARRWDTLLDSLWAGKGDAIIASIAASPAMRAKLDFSQPYYQTPARFVVRRDAPPFDLTAKGLADRKIGVVAGSAHRAFIDTFFPLATAVAFPDAGALHEALRNKEIDAVFGDGLALSIWLGATAADCCVFAGEPYTESKYFGEGVGIALRREDAELRRAVDWALARIWSRGAYREIFLKHFPVSFY